MIIEAVKIVMSVFPFIKEAFLWREGPEAYVPPTKAQLMRRKVAVFVLIGSFFVNYLALTRLYEFHTSDEKLQREKKELEAKLADTQAKLDKAVAQQVNLVPPANCVGPSQMFDLVHVETQKEIQEQIDAGVLKRVGGSPPAKGKLKRGN